MRWYSCQLPKIYKFHSSLIVDFTVWGHAFVVFVCLFEARAKNKLSKLKFLASQIEYLELDLQRLRL